MTLFLQRNLPLPLLNQCVPHSGKHIHHIQLGNRRRISRKSNSLLLPLSLIPNCGLKQHSLLVILIWYLIVLSLMSFLKSVHPFPLGFVSKTRLWAPVWKLEDLHLCERTCTWLIPPGLSQCGGTDLIILSIYWDELTRPTPFLKLPCRSGVW